MSLTIILLGLFVIAVWGLTISVLRKSKKIAIISLIASIFLVSFTLFLILVLIPAM